MLRPSRLALLRLRARPQRSRLLLRAFSDAVDPSKSALGASVAPQTAAEPERAAPHVNGNGWGTNGLNGHTDATQLQMLTSFQDGEEPLHDVEFTAQRIGFPISEAESKESEQDDDIREESREEATAKAERIMSVLRHSMSELEIGKVIHRIAQYATLPRVTGLSRKQFLRSLETRFGGHKKEFGYMLAFLQGKDDVIEQLEVESRQGVEPVAEDGDELSTNPMDEDFVVPKIMGLHPDLVADPKFVSIVFCYCRLACLNSLKLMQRPVAGYSRGSKSSLGQVKNDFRNVLDMEGYSHYADMLGLEKPEKDGENEEMDAVDAEWEEFNLENDRIDFRMLMAQTENIVDFMKREMPNETISKMLVAMLASVKTSKLHRKIFQEMVCNIQTAFPETYHEQLLSELVPFLSGNNATYKDFDSDVATSALQHHQMRNEAIIRALLESRMRVGHILINDIDEVEPTQSVSKKLTPEEHEKVITAAWNIVSVLDDRKYHMFFTRFLKYKLAWRPNRTTFGETFLADVRKTLDARDADAIMPLFEEVYQQLSVETLTICRVKLRHSRKLLRGRGALEPLNDAGRERLETAWLPSRCVFYRNLPYGVTEKHLKKALGHIGEVKRYFLFSNPVSGAPDQVLKDDEDEDDEELYNDDDEEGEKTKKKKKKANKGIMTMKGLESNAKKKKIVASDKKTPYQAVVEFESEEACNKANIRALQIFGVMMAGWKEYRPVFSVPADTRAAITVMNVPYGTTVGSLVDEINGVLAAAGLNMKVSGMVPRGVIMTNGRLDLRFPSFVEAAQVVELLNEHVRFMKERREPVKDSDEYNLKEGFRKFKAALAKQHKQKKEDAKAEEKEESEDESDSEDDEDDDEEIDFAAGGDDDDDDDDGADDEDEDEEDKKKTKKPMMEVRETPSDYFKERLEAEKNLTDEQLALGKKLRPFEVTWTPLPKAKNKHMYL